MIYDDDLFADEEVIDVADSDSEVGSEDKSEDEDKSKDLDDTLTDVVEGLADVKIESQDEVKVEPKVGEAGVVKQEPTD